MVRGSTFVVLPPHYVTGRAMTSSTTPLSALSFTTWNVRGLTSKSKRSSLAADCKWYNIDLVCLQEMKATERDEMLLKGVML